MAQIQMSECTSPTGGGGGVVPPLSTPSTPANNSIRQLAWNCPRFKMEEPAASTTTTTSNANTQQQHQQPPTDHSFSSGSHSITNLYKTYIRRSKGAVAKEKNGKKKHIRREKKGKRILSFSLA